LVVLKIISKKAYPFFDGEMSLGKSGNVQKQLEGYLKHNYGEWAIRERIDLTDFFRFELHPGKGTISQQLHDMFKKAVGEIMEKWKCVAFEGHSDQATSNSSVFQQHAAARNGPPFNIFPSKFATSAESGTGSTLFGVKDMIPARGDRPPRLTFEPGSEEGTVNWVVCFLADLVSTADYAIRNMRGYLKILNRFGKQDKNLIHPTVAKLEEILAEIREPESIFTAQRLVETMAEAVDSIAENVHQTTFKLSHNDPG
jgi:hypothetical protein